MASNPSASMASPTPNLPTSTSSAHMSPLQRPPSPKYGGFTRFEIELEFVQSLANPSYLLHLASSTTSVDPSTNSSTAATSQPTVPLLTHPPFVAYLSYLQYWSSPPYTKYLNYPGPTLKHLQLLQNERFREEVLRPEVVGQLTEEGIRGAVELHSNGR